MNLGLAAAVAITDAVIAYFGWQRLDSWLTGRLARVLIFNALLDVAIAVNTMGFVQAGWSMLLPSLLGSTLGTIASFKLTTTAG